ncbi:adenylate/guanylate cyclase domain-containing protein [Crenothrix sp.]|uniref:adenylate/guanylate cyclase domain-containing protein n=1 Tax=Crenothrix sp. TaxID=3100433 RepID=UPI00374D6A0C
MYLIKENQQADTINGYGELMHGVCLATDADNYKSLSESMNPMTLNALMNKYYSTMFPVIKAHNGLIANLMDDALIALWAKPIAETQLRSDACYAALKINSALQEFNHLPSPQLPTYLGLHYGEMRLSNHKLMEDYGGLPVGNIITTSTQIEALNKILGTRILVSATVIEGLSGFISREIGVFLLKDTTQPIVIFELIDKNDQIDPKLAPLLYAFAKALHLFQQCQWKKAQKSFVNIHKYYPNDGPTIFYINHLERHLTQCPNNPMYKPVIEVSHLSASRQELYSNLGIQ